MCWQELDHRAVWNAIAGACLAGAVGTVPVPANESAMEGVLQSMISYSLSMASFVNVYDQCQKSALLLF